MIFPGCYLLVCTKQQLVEGFVCMLFLLETYFWMSPGIANRVGTINLLPLLQGKPLNVCGKPQTFGPQALKPLRMYVFHWWPWCSSGNLLEILILVTVRDDDKAVNDDMARRWVLGTRRSRVVVEMVRCHCKRSLPTQRNLPENTCAI